MSTTTCMALVATLVPAEPGREGTGGCIGFGAEVAGRFTQRLPRGGVDRGFTLSRSRFDFGMDRDGAGARLVLAGVRSGGEDSYIGVAGESIVPQIQVAEARYRATGMGLTVSAGLVDDPWVSTSNASWDLRATAPGMGESQAWLERSDLGAAAAWTSPDHWATVAGTFTAGEGPARRERNNGQDTAGLLILRPLANLGGEPGLLELHAYGREGSRGLGLTRDHRAGLRMTHRSPWVAGGAEWLRAWGVGGDARRSPRGLSGWAQVTPKATPTLAWARLDHIDEAPGTSNTRRVRTSVGVGLQLPPDGVTTPPLRLLVGWDRETRDESIASLAGAAATTRTDAIFVQLDLRARESTATSPTPQDI
ncbi:MAG: hypothetical protein VX265_10725 [Myxococcota bacterium]|nr:hypothetical protein [Myxococcota bacterium]